MIAQDLWQAHCQTLSLIFLKELIELNINTDKMIKIVKLAELNMCIVTAFFNTKNLEMI